jgi:hypothetical protein
MTELVLLDSEAVQALGNPRHPKHRKVVDQTQLVTLRKARQREISIAVPVTIRVEAGWDRTAAAWAFANKLRIADVPLDTTQANRAAGVRTRTGVSVADAHIGAAVQTAAESAEVAVLTSDPGDIRAVAEGRRVKVIAI